MNKISLILTLFITLFMMTVSPNAQAQDEKLSVDEIVDKANEVAYYQGKTGSADVKMTIIDSQDRTRNREITILRRNMDDKNEEQRFYVYFEAPSDVRKMVFLVWKHIIQDDDRWLYLPDLDLVKRIAATDKRTSFVGSNFFYEDVSGRSPKLDHHELVETSDTYYVVKNTPKDTKFVEFSYYKTWIHKETFLPVRSTYYDENDKEYRMYTAQKVETIQGYPTVVKSEMKNLRTGGKTVNEYSNVKYEIELPENIFTERYLRRPPREYLR